MGDDVLGGLTVVAALACVLVAIIGLLVLRRILLARRLGAFDCALRTTVPGPRGRSVWAPGVARYESDRLDWYPFLGIGGRPTHMLSRAGIEVRGRRPVAAAEAASIQQGWYIVTCEVDHEVVELAMEPAAYDALCAWLESAPPGQNEVFS